MSKLISHAGLCSRKNAEVLIKNGEVKINGKIFREFMIEADLIKTIKVKERYLSKEQTRVWIFNKPVGYVSSNKEQFSQKSLFRLIPKNLPRLVSVGRLDIQSQGIMILTNNPTLSSHLENPKNQVERIYIVKVFGNIPDHIENKKEFLIDGTLYRGIKLNILTHKTNNNKIEIKLTEGKNREIRNILNYFDLKVKKLERISFGPFRLNKLATGKLVEIESFFLRKILKTLRFKNENYFG